MNTENKVFRYGAPVLLVLLIVFLLGQMKYLLEPLKSIAFIVFTPLIFSALFYYMLRPVVHFLVQKKWNKTVAVSVVFLLLAVLVFSFGLLGQGFIQQEFSSFYENMAGQFQKIFDHTQSIIEEEEIWIFPVEDLEGRLASALQVGVEAVAENFSGWLSALANFGTILILIPIVSFFLLKDDRFFYQNILAILPKKRRKTFRELAREIDDTLSVYITGQLIVAFFLGVVTFIGYLIIGLPNAFILAVISMITSIIPFIGPALGVVPAILIGLTVDLFMVVKVFIVLAISQQLEGNLIRPNVLGTRLQIHPLVIIFLIIIAIMLYGFIGAFIAIPVYSVIRVVARYFWNSASDTVSDA